MNDLCAGRGVVPDDHSRLRALSCPEGLHRNAVKELTQTKIDLIRPMGPASGENTVAMPGIPSLNCVLSRSVGIEIWTG